MSSQRYRAHIVDFHFLTVSLGASPRHETLYPLEHLVLLYNRVVFIGSLSETMYATTYTPLRNIGGIGSCFGWHGRRRMTCRSGNEHIRQARREAISCCNLGTPEGMQTSSVHHFVAKHTQ
jgi:hypothetical protein